MLPGFCRSTMPQTKYLFATNIIDERDNRVHYASPPQAPSYLDSHWDVVTYATPPYSISAILNKQQHQQRITEEEEKTYTATEKMTMGEKVIAADTEKDLYSRSMKITLSVIAACSLSLCILIALIIVI